MESQWHFLIRKKAAKGSLDIDEARAFDDARALEVPRKLNAIRQSRQRKAVDALMLELKRVLRIP